MQVLRQVDQKDVADVPQGAALLTGKGGQAQNRTDAGGVAHLAGELERREVAAAGDRRLGQLAGRGLVVQPDGVAQRTGPQPRPHIDKVVAVDGVGRLAAFLADSDERAAVEDAQRLAAADAVKRRILDFELHFLGHGLAGDGL